jgi:hypothetical protein
MQDDGAWANGRVERDEGTLYFRINTALVSVRDGGPDPYEALFTVSFFESKDIDSELERVNAVEDLLKERLEVDGK